MSAIASLCVARITGPNHWTETVHQRIAKHRVVQDREPYQDVPCYLRLMLPLVG
jgi:hypothetical protein